MTQYNKWEIWNAKVEFEETAGSKVRPVLIISEKELYVFSLKMTSHEPRYNILEGEYEVMKWKDAGLKKPTVIQCSKKLMLQYDKLINKCGRLQATDIALLQQLLKYMRVAM